MFRLLAISAIMGAVVEPVLWKARSNKRYYMYICIKYVQI